MSLGPHVGSAADASMRTVKLSDLVNRGRVARTIPGDGVLDSEMEELLLLGHEVSTTHRRREGAIRQLALDLLRHVRAHRSDDGLLTREALRSIEKCLRAMDGR